MSNTVYWFKEASDGFYASISGFAASNGSLWSGKLTSFNGHWQMTFPATKVEKAITGGFKYNFGGLSIAGKQLDGGLTFATGGGSNLTFQNVPWGTGVGEIWNFRVNEAPVNNWEGRGYLTLFNARNFDDFTSWRFNLDVEVKKIT